MIKKENHLFDMGAGRSVGSDLGGMGSQLRYYVVLYHIDSIPLDCGLKVYCETCIHDIDWTVESIETVEDALVFCVLVDVDIAVDTVVMQYIDMINSHGQCVLRGYGAINTEYPSQSFIDDTRTYLHQLHDQGML